MISAFAEALSAKSVILTAARTLTSDEGSAALTAVDDWAAASYPNFGVMCASLSVDSSVFYPPNALISAYSRTHPCGFQFVANSGDPGRLGGSLVQALVAGDSLLQGIGMIETYAYDCDNAVNAPALSATGAALQQ